MPKKVALLIGVSQYGEGLLPLSAAPNDVAALKRVLENPEMAGFDQIKSLIDPGLVEMQDAILHLFSQCSKDDLLLLYFSGHGITDDLNRLYLANQQTSKDNFRARAVPASFIQQESMNCYTRRQVIILDCCYSGAFKEGWQAKAAGVDLQKELGAEGRVVLTSSTATQTSFQQQEADLSLYTQYLIEGIETGAADADQDGKIFVQDLHEYAKTKVQEARPTMKPEILLDREGFNILLSKAPMGDRTLDFRRLVEESVRQGEISTYRRDVLRVKQQEWGLTEEAAESIINSVLEPFRRRLANLERFRAALQAEVDKQFPLDMHLENDLRDWQQQVLGLADEDVAEIWQQATADKAEDYAARSQAYEQAILDAISLEYPLSTSVRQELSRIQQSLRLTDEEVHRIEVPMLASAEARFQELKRQETERQQQQAATQQRQEAERLRQERAAAERQQQEAEQQRQAQAEAERQRQAAEQLRAQEAERQRQQAAEAEAQRQARQRQPSATHQVREPIQSPETTRPWTRRQVMKWAGFGGIGLLVTAIAASLRGLFSSVRTPQSTPSDATAAKLSELPLGTVNFETVTVNERGDITNRASKQAKFVKEDLGNGITLELMSIPAGTFTMGSPATEKGRGSDEGPQRQVTVPAFAMGRYAVTQAQYQAIMGTNPSNFKGANRPVETVSWNQAVEFCIRLSKRTGRTYDLPSEAEWEYACRAGTTTPFHFGETITTALVNFDGNDTYASAPKGEYRQQTTTVGSFPPNVFGLYDMHGNVREWCLDHYRDSYQGAPTDGSAWVTNNKDASRLLRGGSWVSDPVYCRSASRLYNDPGYRNYNVGFRVVLRPA